MIRIVTVLGARPQFIKAASLSRVIAATEGVHEIIIHTGQHYDANMSDVFFEQMQIPKPDYFLNVVSKYHGEMTGRMIEAIEKVLLDEKPDFVLVYGDTNSTVAGALAARKLNIPVAHVEAGLRSFNMRMPEEINRIVTDRISDLLFCPGEQAVENLRQEGFENFDACVVDVGDIMKDVAYFYRPLARRPDFNIDGNFFLATLHRAENTDNLEKLEQLVTAFNAVAEYQQIILPLHPRTRKILNNVTVPISANIKLVDPVGYLEMLYLLQACELVITDSGGLQKEAYFFGKPCVTTRNETEWTELVEFGYNKVVGSSKEHILRAIDDFRVNPPEFSTAIYGDGQTSKRIVELLVESKLKVDCV